MRLRTLSLVFVAFASGAFGQGVDQRVELEEFAVDPDERGGGPSDLNVSQIGEPAGANTSGKVSSGPIDTDRSILRSPQRDGADTGVAQVSRAASDLATAQVARGEGDLRSVQPDALSSPDQSAPEGVTRLGGQDRCDPQVDQSLYRACLRILERRAGDFAAPTAPVLSAEEALLAQRRADDEDPATLTIEQRIRRASQTAPDAELSSNQELASLFLPGTAPPPAQPVEDSTTLQGANLEAVLKAIGLTVPPQP
ncbi:hypothetical protein GCM10022600_20680 [Qipengyuania pelagi]|jgi:hypothetical protein|uniref:Uncharacterized protein n=1 Tax=Qipengyuania pelagi TaxID=994320 RepID=A0A844Y7S3_9SPHN|nr:hypothetical protein [Qipengyuania pelagi]MXO53088.1 hypothetical protein [Qipengyuania pelagi]